MKKYGFAVKLFTLHSLLLLGLNMGGQAQLGLGITTPNNNAALHLNATNRGFLAPRMTAAQRLTLSASLTKAERGLAVLDSVSGKHYYWDSIKWTNTVIAPKLPLIIIADSLVINPGTAVGDLLSWDGVNWVSKQPAPPRFTCIVNKQQPTLALNYCISLYGVYPNMNDQPFVGEIRVVGFNFDPLGWAKCDGQLLSIAQNDVLFTLIGTYYGGDGQNTFALPDLRSRVPIHMGTGPNLSTRSIAETGGTETQTIIK